MKVKIGDKIYSDTEQPIMLILTKEDRFYISNLCPKATKYCAAPETTTYKDMKKFMRVYKKNMITVVNQEDIENV